jgi:glycosyltransferase involved in cell wall biosynthesis
LMQHEAVRLGLGPDDVTFHGYIPSHQAALAIVAACHVGVVPHLANQWANTTIPNKLFDYMAAGLPVVVSSAPPLARIVSATGCGLVFEDRNPASLAAALEALFEPERRANLGAAGRLAVQKRYHWESDVLALSAAITSVL